MAKRPLVLSTGTMGWAATSMYVYRAGTPLGNFSASSRAGHYWHAYTKGTGTSAGEGTVAKGKGTGTSPGQQISGTVPSRTAATPKKAMPPRS